MPLSNSSTRQSELPADLEKTSLKSSFYLCQRCTACCRLPGFVRLLPQELEPIAAYINISIEELTKNYCELLPSRSGLTLISRTDNSCIFLEGNSCKIHPVKPLQCRGFPNTWNFPGWRNICKAIPVKNQKHSQP